MIIVLVVLGLVLGSFINALVWRLHEYELTDKKGHHGPDSKNTNLSILSGRSMCPNCHHKLAAKDLIPIFSWVTLKGKCRYCHKPISWQYPLIEIITPVIYAISYYCWPVALHGFGLFEFILWLIFLVGFIALAIYDARWLRLPNRIVYPLLLLAIFQVLVNLIFYDGGFHALTSAFWGVIIAGGIFYAIFHYSRGKWIGGGDVKIGAILGLLVGGPANSLLLLFFASCLGSVYSLPLLMQGKVKKDSRIPFGPFLLIAGVIIQLFGTRIIHWYVDGFPL